MASLESGVERFAESNAIAPNEQRIERGQFSSQLQAFMSAIATMESGHDYNARSPHVHSEYGYAYGKYQIMSEIWKGWAREAGIPSADMRNPQAQERVATFKMTQYYERYGRWDAVAVAWFGGPGAADQWINNPDSVAGREDANNFSILQYANRAMRLMREAGGNPDQVLATVGVPKATGGADVTMKDSGPDYVSVDNAARNIMEGIQAAFKGSVVPKGTPDIVQRLKAPTVQDNTNKKLSPFSRLQDDRILE